jgi:hypothetical protein
MGLCYDAMEINLFVEHVVPQFKNITYSVYGFEADPDSANVIKDRYKNNPNVHIENIAISNSKVPSIFRDVFSFFTYILMVKFCSSFAKRGDKTFSISLK